MLRLQLAMTRQRVIFRIEAGEENLAGKMFRGGLARIFIFFSFFIILIYLVYYHETRMVVLTEVDVFIEDLPAGLDGFTILHLSDLHGASFGKNQDRLIKMVKNRRFDLVAVTGDMVDARNPDVQPGITLAAKMKALAPVYFVNGNHEVASRRWPELRAGLQEHGAEVLENRTVAISRGGATLLLSGLNYPWRRAGLSNLPAHALERRPDTVHVLLAHDPAIFREATQKEVDLVLSGHTHGGQVCLPFVGALFNPDGKLFPKHAAGLFRQGKTNLYVNRGLGTSVLPFRFLARPEMALIRLKRS